MEVARIKRLMNPFTLGFRIDTSDPFAMANLPASIRLCVLEKMSERSRNGGNGHKSASEVVGSENTGIVGGNGHNGTNDAVESRKDDVSGMRDVDGTQVEGLPVEP